MDTNTELPKAKIKLTISHFASVTRTYNHMERLIVGGGITTRGLDPFAVMLQFRSTWLALDDISKTFSFGN